MLGVLSAITVFVSAGLLFGAQPMVARGVLPVLGGSPAVWTTCVAFFQASLLLGYAWAHGLSLSRGRVGAQAAIHGVLLILAMAVLPMVPTPGEGPTTEGTPALWLIGHLLAVLGVPIVCLSATAPLIQSWYRRGGRGEPYRLYAASNLGSFAALMSYPFLIEPMFDLTRQGLAWSLGFVMLATLVLGCGWVAASQGGGDEVPSAIDREASAAGPGWRAVVVWMVLAAVPSSLLLGVTSHVTTDLASAPLLWVVPLGLYLLSFVNAFASRPWVSVERVWSVVPWLLVAVTLSLVAGLVWAVWVPAHWLVFATLSLLIHGVLAAKRPGARDLTAYYLAMAAGGVIGGTFNAVVAPMVFDRMADYPLMIAVAGLVWAWVGGGREGEAREAPSSCAFRPPSPPRAGAKAIRGGWHADVILPLFVLILGVPAAMNWGGFAGTAGGALAVTLASGLVVLAIARWRSRPTRFALVIAALLAIGGVASGVDGRVLARGRNFFGAWRVTRDADAGLTRFFHGTTLHGQQAIEPERTREPLAYFTREGPAGDVFAFEGREGPRRVAVVGLGIGALASYARPGDDWTFLELDPDVVRVARDSGFFSYLADARSEAIRIVVGDGRIGLRSAPETSFDRIILDAFGSDAVPIHLLTREAVGEYLARLAPGGVIAMNLSNRYLDLASVVGAVARDANLACRVRADVRVTPDEKKRGREPSIWAVLARTEADLGGPLTGRLWWRPVAARRAWTDDRADVLSALRLGGGRSRPTSAGAGTIEPFAGAGEEGAERPRTTYSSGGGPSS